jgi:Rps23 Pro-64 3,4-dihydroxylase Tpa1-like proline 4-hydroxylase
MRNELAGIIADRLERERDTVQAYFNQRQFVQTGHFIVDDLLPEPVVREIHAAFPDHGTFRRLSSFRERKSTSKSLDALPPILSDITFAFQDARVVRLVEEITGIRNQLPDPHLYAGGLSIMVRGDFLNPHIDNSHDKDRENYRTVNLLYYVSPDWGSESGGNFELWDERVRNPVEVVSKFNRLLVMETNTKSWHSVNAVRADRPRCCVSNYYFSPDPPEGFEHFHITAFSARPEQPLRRLVARADSALRMTVRRFAHRGVGKRDIYRGPADASR